MGFDTAKCIVKTVYCGNAQPNATHSRVGTPYECLQQGIGSIIYAEKKKTLPKKSLLQIKYVSSKFLPKFRRYGIYSQTTLISVMRQLSKKEKRTVLKSILQIKTGIDYRAYNHVLLFLHNNNIVELPNCKRL